MVDITNPRLPVNARILEYKIVADLGAGGFANTYRAIDTNLDKHVAIKEFFPARLCQRGENYRVEPSAESEEKFKRYLNAFIEEARILAKFDQRNIVKVLRYFEALGTAFIIMELVDGRPMSDYFAFDNVLGEERVSKWMNGILEGLSVIHQADIIHGDIKPKNILITEDDEAVLIDFGASVIYKSARETGEPMEEMALSPNYAAPEQISTPTKLDRRLDLYSLGSVFYEAITSEKLRDAVAANTDIGADLLRYKRFYNQKLLLSVGRALQTDRDLRFQDADEWLDFIILSAGEQFSRALRRNRKKIVALIFVIAAIGFAYNYVETNEIDQKNYKYKLLASQQELLQLFQTVDGYIDKLNSAKAFLASYGNEYQAQIDKIQEKDLVTGRNTKASLLSYKESVADTTALLSASITTLEHLRGKFYFDNLAVPLEMAERAIQVFGAKQPDLNTLLFAAYTEVEIIARAKEQSIIVDEAALASLITGVQNGEKLQDLAALVPTAQPIIDRFLHGQLAQNQDAAFEVARAKTINQIKDVAEPFRKNSHFINFGAFTLTVAKANRLAQLELALKGAKGLAKKILAEQKLATIRRAVKRRNSQRRTVANRIDSAMIGVAAGEFTMGSNRHGYSRPPRNVSVKPFFVAGNEITHAQWNECVKDKACTNATTKNVSDFPVTGVSWDDTQSFIKWLNGISTRFAYRLPTEAEWEYVVKKHGFVLKEIESTLASTSVKQINQLGVNSIVGNALEWLDDCWHGGYVGAPPDSSSWNRGLQCSRRIVRGANWEDEYQLTEDNVAYFRPFGVEKSEKKSTLGFRLAGDRK